MTLTRIEVEGKGRHYVHEDGRKRPSVTNVLGVLPKAALVPWAAKVERELCVRVANEVYSRFYAAWEKRKQFGPDFPCPEFPEEFSVHLDDALPRKKAHTFIVKEAQDIGKEAHALIEWRIRGELGLERGDEPECSEPALWAVAGFEDWRRGVNFVPTHTEERLWSEELDAAGATDAITCQMDVDLEDVTMTLEDLAEMGLVRYGEYGVNEAVPPKSLRISAIVDWKSSRKLWSSNDVQVAVYRHMAIERGILDERAWALILRLPKTLEDPEFEARALPPSACRKLIPVFQAARVIWEWDKKSR